MAANDNRDFWSRFSRSTRLRLLALLVVLVTSTVFSIGYVSILMIRTLADSAQAASVERLDAQITTQLRRANSDGAQMAELMLRRVESDVKELSLYAGEILASESGFEPSGYWLPSEKMFFGDEEQYINGPDDLSSVYLPNFVDLNAELLKELEHTAYLDPLFAAVHTSAPGVEAVYFGSVDNFTRYYPNINLGSFLPPDWDIQQRSWYTKTTPLENPDREVQWTEVYVDATGKGLLVTAAAPVYAGPDADDFLGVIGIDLSLAQISTDLAREYAESGYVLLLDGEGQPIVLSPEGYQDILGNTPPADDTRVDLRTTETEFAPLIEAMVAGEKGYTTVQAGARDLVVAYEPLENQTGWSLAHIRESQSRSFSEVVQADVEDLVRELTLYRILPVMAGILFVILLVGSLTIRHLTSPLKNVITALQEFEQGNWDFHLEETNSDEINQLVRALNTMRAYVRETVNTLETRVSERTSQLEERTVQLQAAAELSQTLTNREDMRSLLDTAADFVSERLGVYHVGIFLQDDTGAWMLLRAATSEGGRRLLKAGHKLRIGGESIIGYVSSTARSRIALDVGADAVYFDNPELPETRSELALPLLAHGELVGTLDLQSKEKRAFSEADVDVLRILANTLATLIERTQLLVRTNQTVERLERYQEQEALSGWYRILARRQREVAYTYDRVTVEQNAPGTKSLLPFVREQLKGVQVKQVDDKYFLLAPILMQNRTLGVLTFTAAHPWSQEARQLVEDVVSQLSLALDNARLLEGSRLRASREQARSEIVGRVRDSVQVEAILRSAVEELGQTLQVDRVRLQLVNRLEGAEDED